MLETLCSKKKNRGEKVEVKENKNSKEEQPHHNELNPTKNCKFKKKDA